MSDVEPLEMVPERDRPVHPNTGASPEWVIRAFLEGLREPHGPTHEDGFSSAYNLSTPEYRASLGHFEGFVREMESAFMSMLLGHDAVKRGPLEVDDDVTRVDQRVLVINDGDEYIYQFSVAKQHDGKYEDCWLVDEATLVMDEPESFHHMPTVEYEGVEIKCRPGDDLRDVVAGTDGLSPYNGRTSTLNCGAKGLCGTCAVEIVDSAAPLNERTKGESRRLGLPPFRSSEVPNLRLSCRTEVTGDVRVRKHDGKMGQKRTESDAAWHETVRDGETIRVHSQEYESVAGAN